MMDNLIAFWTDILSGCLINEISNYEQKVFEFCQSNKNMDSYYDFHMALKSVSDMLHFSIKDTINEYQQHLKQELDKANKKNKQLVADDPSSSFEENDLTEENLRLKEELKKKKDELEKAYYIIEIMRLSSLELPLNNTS